MVQVKVLGKRDNTALVEWVREGRLYRGYVPLSQVEQVEGKGYCQNPDQSIPYGIPWSLIVDKEIDADAFEAELYRRGIWTQADFERNPQVVISSLQKVLKQTVGQMRKQLLEFQGE